MQTPPSFREEIISQIPAIQMLCAMGYRYLTPAEAMQERGNLYSSVVLENILRERLQALNRIQYRGESYAFSDANIQSAVLALKDAAFGTNFMNSNHEVYDLLTLGKSFEQSILGDKKSFTLRYIDWEHPENNVYHVSAEFDVVRTGRPDHYIPDIVLFVNGIPFVVIECKRPDIKDALEKAVEQHLRSQLEDGIRPLYVYSQILIALAVNETKYATTGTPKEFWSGWKEPATNKEDAPGMVYTLKNTPMQPEERNRLFQAPFGAAREHFDQLEQGLCSTAHQDKILYSLCRPERLLDIVFRFIVFEGSEKKICRYTQYFGVKKVLARIKARTEDGRRKGGVLWHTQGSGKSLTMILIAQHIALDKEIKNPKIVLVTDRTDLDYQIWNTFEKCDKEVYQAKTGKDLMQQLRSNSDAVITTVINKFNAAINQEQEPLSSPNIFVLVDEGHRSQYGTFASKMRRVFENACFIGFTGTPLKKKEKNTAEKFGGMIDVYSIEQAVEDKAVVPLLFEGRYIDQEVNEKPLDAYFAKIAEPLNEYQRAELKQKFSRADQLNKADQKLYVIAWDISEHFDNAWGGDDRKFKGQLVTPDKKTALRFKEHLDTIGKVTSEVLISPPDEREGVTDIYETPDERIQAFWRKMVDRYSTAKNYAKEIIERFKGPGDPQIIIVVDKLLTGFDAPRNIVLYITRSLKEHTLLQAIARVNRVYPGKEYGYIIDYYGVLRDLDEAMKMYSGRDDGFDPEDLKGMFTTIETKLQELPQKYSNVRALFRGIPNEYDTKAYEELLRDESLRLQFYDRLSAFARLWNIALLSNDFIKNHKKESEEYEKWVKFFIALRNSVRQIYSDTIDYKEYEHQIQRLIDNHVTSSEVTRLTGLIDIFDREKFESEVAKMEGIAAKADMIASRTTRYITENMEQDPYYYKKLSALIKKTIEEYRQGRISEAEYLYQTTAQKDLALNPALSVPEQLRGQAAARAFYGVLLDAMEQKVPDAELRQEIGVHAALDIEELVRKHLLDGEKPKIDWWNNSELMKEVKLGVMDYIYDHVKDKYHLSMTMDEMEAQIEHIVGIVRVQYR